MKKLIAGFFTTLFGPVAESEEVREINTSVDIQYMQKAKKWMEKYGWSQEISGVPESKILLVESEIGHNFPKAYREFLLLTGKRFQPIRLSHGFEWIVGEEMNKLAKENLIEFNIDVIKKDFWVFAEYNGSEAITFFYFDEGDNPPVYFCDMDFKDEVPDYYYKAANTFQEYVESYINVYNPRDFRG